MEITYFSPGRLTPPGPPLAAYRHPTAANALDPYLDAYTRPSDLVVDLFCQAPTLIRQAVQAGRRGLGLNVNRALLLGARLGLMAVDRQAVEAAFTQLAEAQKGPETLQAFIEGLYRTTCAVCNDTAIADAFTWEQDSDQPVMKRYHCRTCEKTIEAPTDEADRAKAASFERRGLSYWLLLDRAAHRDAPHRERAASLLEVYTARALVALNSLLLKSDGLRLSLPVRDVIDGLLLDTLDQSTGLRPPDNLVSKPRRLRRPARYLERNVWRLLEDALIAWRDSSPTPVPLAPTLDSLIDQDQGSDASAHLATLSSSQARRVLPPHSVALIVIDPPRPDSVQWHLSALWGYWLWGADAGDPLAPLLRRRWLDKDWLWRGLQGALRAVTPVLRPDGRLVSVFTDENRAILEAVILATAGAGGALIGWGTRRPGDVRLNWHIHERTMVHEDTSTISTSSIDTLSRAIAQRAADAALEALRTRGEPVPWATLHASILAGLADSGLLAQVAGLAANPAHSQDALAHPLSWLSDTIRSALAGAPLRQLPNQPSAEPLWWLEEPLESEAVSPLSDRVELAVADILRDVLAVNEMELQRRVCARFPGPQTPDAYLIRLCLFSYGDEHAPGHWRLRAEDDLEARVAETDAIITDLSALGKRLGFEIGLGIASAGEWAVRWVDEQGHTPYAFSVHTTAVLSDCLFNPPVAKTAQEPETRATIPCLTLPGGRAILVGYKLRHDPRLRKQVERHGWQFLKFRHLRRLVQQAAAKQLDHYAFRAALGLDPIVEQEEAQMTLW